MKKTMGLGIAGLAMAGLASIGLSACGSSHCGFDLENEGFLSTQAESEGPVDFYWTCDVKDTNSGFLIYWLDDGTGASEGLGNIGWTIGDQCGTIDVTAENPDIGDFTMTNIEVSGDGDTFNFDMLGTFDLGEEGTFDELNVECDKYEPMVP